MDYTLYPSSHSFDGKGQLNDQYEEEERLQRAKPALRKTLNPSFKDMTSLTDELLMSYVRALVTLDCDGTLLDPGEAQWLKALLQYDE